MSEKWEYVVDHVRGSLSPDWLNGYGDDGWELVSAVFIPNAHSYSDDHWILTFKRPKKQ